MPQTCTSFRKAAFWVVFMLGAYALQAQFLFSRASGYRFYIPPGFTAPLQISPKTYTLGVALVTNAGAELEGEWQFSDNATTMARFSFLQTKLTRIFFIDFGTLVLNKIKDGSIVHLGVGGGLGNAVNRYTVAENNFDGRLDYNFIRYYLQGGVTTNRFVSHHSFFSFRAGVMQPFLARTSGDLTSNQNQLTAVIDRRKLFFVDAGFGIRLKIWEYYSQVNIVIPVVSPGGFPRLITTGVALSGIFSQ